jgi:hypothetical protein
MRDRLSHDAVHVLRRTDRDDDLGVGHNLFQTPGHMDLSRELHARKVGSIFGVFANGADNLFFITPEGNGVTIAMKKLGEGGAPAPGAHHSRPD